MRKNKTKKTVTIKKHENHILRVYKTFSDLKWRIMFVLLIGILGIIAFSIMPTYLKAAINSLENTIPNPDMRYVFEMLGILVALLIVNEVFAVICMFLILDYEARGTQKLGMMVKRKLDVVPVAALEKYNAGDLTRIVGYNVSDMMKNVLATLYLISRALFFYITTSIAMFSMNVLLAFVVISSLPLCILTARFVSKRTQKYFNNQNTLNGDLSTYIDRYISKHGFYKTHGLGGDMSLFNEKNKEHSKSIGDETVCTSLNTMYINFIRDFMNVLITVLCCILFINGELLFAALPAFLMYSQRFLSQAVVVTNATNVLQVLSARAARVFEILDYPSDVTEGEHINITKLNGDIKFENVTLIEDSETIVDNISFTIQKGTSVGIIGPTGSGKHKVVELLAKLALPSRGRITIGDTDLREINSESYYDRIGIAFEKPFIFKGTVAENILYCAGRALPEKVMNITKLLKSHEFIESLPQGYDTELCDKTTVLGESQKQAINVARTVLEAPDLCIMDAALSFADNIIERQVFEEIMKLDKNQTKIFVTTRLNSIQNCDIIIYMEEGRIIEMGNHKQLMAKKKKYYKAFTGATTWKK